ncbi:hypothetical protein UL357_002542 [Enterococcus faecalis]|nr:hypothetical protein [Enterococcus faecalis]
MNLAGSTQKYISLGKLREIPFLLPKSDTLMDFCEIANTINNKISMCVEENNSLKELRDTLLPKLLSGEIELE